MKQKLSVTIGIPAYNEERNIKDLIVSILRQRVEKCRLKEILIATDGSTDRTVENIRKIKNKKIHLIEGTNRKGKSFRLDQITRSSTSDVLVICDADIQIKDNLFIQKITKPILDGKADLVSVSVKEINFENHLQRMLAASMKLKKRIFIQVNNGNNIYTCHGRARAFSKKLYKTIKFNRVVVDDAFSYLFCKTNNYRYRYENTAAVWYTLPSTYSDHEKQSLRFYHSMKNLTTMFSRNLINKEYKLPFWLSLKETINEIVKHPVLVQYFIMTFYIGVKARFTKFTNWGTAQSTK